MAGKKKNGRFGNAIRQMGAVRIILSSLVAFFGGGLAFALAASGTERVKNPDVALLFMPMDSTALANSADRRFLQKPQHPSAATIRMTRNALRQQAINPKALRLLGFIWDVQGKPEQATALIQQANLLSRREPGTQMWLIESTARNGDAQSTLGHYDTLLRTKPDAQAVLFPRLTNAIVDADVRTALLPYMRSDKGWITGFVGHAIYNSEDLSPLITLLTEAKGFPKTAASRGQELELITRLVAQKKFDDVQRVYRMIPGMDARRLTDAAFDVSDRDARFGAIGWTLSQETDVGGGFASSGTKSRPMLSVFANPATTRIVASKLLYLTPGAYNFTAALSEINRSDGGAVRWQMRCAAAANAQPVWQTAMPAAKLATALSVPAGCSVQFLDLVVSGGDGQSGMDAVISSVSIIR